MAVKNQKVIFIEDLKQVAMIGSIFRIFHATSPIFETVLRIFLMTAIVMFYASPASARGSVKPKSGVPEAQESIDKAWAALDEEMGIKEVEEAIVHLEKALELDPKNSDLLAELSQEYFWHGDLLPERNVKENITRNKWFKKGIEAADESLDIKETVAGHYWYASNLAAMKKNKNIFSQAASFPKIRRHLRWVEKHDRDYGYGSAAFFWSRIVVEAPSAARRLIGEDPNQIFEEIEKSIAIEPLYIKSHVCKARFYYHMEKKDEALEILGRALEMDPLVPPQEKAANRYALKLGHKLWKEWTGKEYPAR